MVLRISSCRPTRLVPGLVWEIGPLVRCKGHVFGVFGLGLGGLWCFPCYLFPFFVLPISPTPEPGAIWVRLTTHTGAQDRSLLVLTFRFSVDTCLMTPPLRGIVGMRGSMVIRLRPCKRSSTYLLSSTPPPLAGGMTMAFVNDLFCPLRLGLPFFLCYWHPLPAS